MERHEILDAMSELKLYGMRASFDEVAGKGLARRDEIYPLIASLIRAERTHRQARSSAATRGFTGQEHIDAMCAINLNARVYDPVIGRSMSADSIVPDPANGQVFNRFSYTNNESLSSTDPSGHVCTANCSENDGPTFPDPGVWTDWWDDPFLGDPVRACANPGCGQNVSDGPGGDGNQVSEDPIEKIVVTAQGNNPEPVISNLSDPSLSGLSFSGGLSGGLGAGGINEGGGLGAGAGGGSAGSGGGGSFTPASYTPSPPPNPGDRCNATLVGVGNWFKGASKFAGDVSWRMEAGGLIVAGGAQLFGPEAEPAAVGGLAFAGVGGWIGIGAGGFQTIGGVLQGLGGAGYSNAWNGAFTTAGGLTLGALARSAQSGNTVSQRLLNRFIDNSGIVAGGTYDTLVSRLDALAPQEKSCN